MSSEHLTHLQNGQLGEVTLIVGDPSRVDLISKDWSERHKVEDSREFVLVIGKYKGHNVSICSTGMGVGSTEICIIELIENGAKQIIRCGGCGSWREDIELEISSSIVQWHERLDSWAIMCLIIILQLLIQFWLVNYIEKHNNGGLRYTQV